MKQAIVYLLDDEEYMLSLLCEMVEDAGLIACGYRKAKLFFEQVTEFEEGALLVLDLSMPEMDGIEVMRRLATMPNSPALILISGHNVGVLH